MERRSRSTALKIATVRQFIMKGVSKKRSTRQNCKRFVTLSVALVTSCSPPSDMKKGRDLLKIESFFNNITAVNGLRGTFEGVYSYPGSEGSDFFFCSKDECPDLDFIRCHPDFSEKAAEALEGYWEDNSYYQIRVIASGHIETGASYGHLGAHVCKFLIDNVKDPVPLDDVVYRSKLYPDLASKPSEEDNRFSESGTSSR